MQDTLARDTEDVGEELGKVEEFSVENAMDPVLDVCSLADKEVAQPNQLPEVAMMARHDPGGSDHPFEGQKSDHLRIDLVGLLMSKRFDISGIPNNHRNTIIQQIMNADPVIRGGLTGDHITFIFEDPIPKSK